MKQALFIGLLLLAACPAPAVSPPTDSNECETAQNQLLALECKDSRGELLGGPNKHGVSFADRCKNIENEGGVELNAHCLSHINECSEVDACLQQN